MTIGDDDGDDGSVIVNGGKFDNDFSSLMIEPEEQLQTITRLINDADLVAGDIWYLTSMRWMMKWSNFCRDPETFNSPGPIDNTDIILDGKVKGYGFVEIRHGLVLDRDYVALSRNAWNKLLDWYGLGLESISVSRPIVMIENRACLALELIKVHLQEENKEHVKEILVPKELSLASFWALLTGGEERELFEKKNDEFSIKDEQLFVCSKYEKKLIDNVYADDVTIEEIGLSLADVYCLLVRGGGGGRVDKEEENDYNNDDGNDIEANYMKRPMMNNKPVKAAAGIAGLYNLGNTCFMNSALQCLSNCEPLTRYFLKEKHLSELNTSNPIGTGGAIVTAYGNLMRMLWESDGPAVVDPSQFKYTLGRFESRFLGYQQHDSQELLSCLLDKLHEDVNRVKLKPYIELEDSDGRPDHLVALEAWENHKLRNDSIVTDNFHGQFKSTVICSVCGYQSITFDPFEFLSLPLSTPSSKKKEKSKPIKVSLIKGINMEIVYIDNLDVEVSSISDLLDSLVAMTMTDLKEKTLAKRDLFAVEIFNHELYKAFSLDHRLSRINLNSDEIFIYSAIPGQDYAWLTFKMVMPSGFSSLVAFPFLVSLEAAGDDDSAKKSVLECLYDFTAQLLSPMGYQDLNLTELIKFEKDPLNLNTRYSSYIGEIEGYKLQELHGINADSIFESFVQGTERMMMMDSSHDDEEFYTKSQSFSTLPVIPLKECLDAFCALEELDKDQLWYCKRCKTHQMATKKMDFWRLSNILIVHLKRFSYARLWGDKITTPVAFPINNFEIAQLSGGVASYNLFAISNHFGSLGGGHYTACARNFVSGKWHAFDDSLTLPLDPETLESLETQRSSYLLFYELDKKAKS